MTGYTDTYVKVAVPVRKCPQIVDNEIINVRITGLLTKEMVIGVAE